MTQKSLIYSKTIKIFLKNKVFINKIKIMKKVVRLNESDIVRLVKKVISENKRLLNEDEKIDNWVPIKLGQWGLLEIEGVKWKMKLPEQNGKDQYLVVKGLWNSNGQICVGNNEDWTIRKQYCMDSDDQKQFASKWYDAKQNNRPKFTLESTLQNVDFIRA